MSKFAHGIRGLDLANGTYARQPILMLGKEYKDPAAQCEAYMSHFRSVMWMTYRRDFPAMVPYEYTSDAGWGCMLRSGQMMLFQTLQRHFLGEEWRLRLGGSLPPEFVKLLRLFIDSPNAECQYSIHRMVKVGMQYDKLPGEWYGPTTAAQVLRDLVNVQCMDGGGIAMYVPQEGVIYTDEVDKLCCPELRHPSVKSDESCPIGNSKEEASTVDSTLMYDPLFNPPEASLPKIEWKSAVLILVPLRLGLDRLNDTYKKALQIIFGFPQSVGIIGGKRGHSVYFIGSQDTHLHILDPHTVHYSANPEDSTFPTDSYINTVQCMEPLVMDLENIDPSLALGFYCRDQKSYEDLRLRIETLTKQCTVPFSMAACRPDYCDDNLDMDSLINDMSSSGMEGTEEDDDEEYVMI